VVVVDPEGRTVVVVDRTVVVVDVPGTVVVVVASVPPPLAGGTVTVKALDVAGL